MSRYLYITFALWLSACPVSAAEISALVGVWGSERQCAQAPIVPGGSKRAAPFDIREGWMRHGATWCKLDWVTVSERDDGLFAASRALCGEDAARSYALSFALTGETLTLIWDETLVNGPMRRCP